MDKQTLESTAEEFVAPGKGILAADESSGTATKRLEGVILKPNMVISGEDARKQASPKEVARCTIQTMLLRSVPAAVPVIMSLSVGQYDVGATEHLNVTNTTYEDL